MEMRNMRGLLILMVLIGMNMGRGEAQLVENFYSGTCPNVEFIVRQVVSTKFAQTFVTVPATLRLFFHDCFVEAGGSTFNVEMGRRDGLISKASRVKGNLPEPTAHLDELNAMFSKNNLSQLDMIALSGAHTVGFSHCNRVANRIYSFTPSNPIDPSLDSAYAQQLMASCPRDVDPTIAIDMDPTTPRAFDNVYYQNLVANKGLFTSDQVLFTDAQSKQTVLDFANNAGVFNAAFGSAMRKLGRVGVKTGGVGEIRRDCTAFNS
ncbi:hypothetical protein F8388_010279 [Cannabis sativa]|uniref:peroxidase n=1 Tax=Cannabis sativa TaxID=3483 RepID=A0A7J6GS19_CANSA|nr:hypothetical protein F8388_010279 [Cannabis sativa]